MTTTIPEVPLPRGFFDDSFGWQGDKPQMPHRHIWGDERSIAMLGNDRSVPDHEVTVSTVAVQYADGTIDRGAVEVPNMALMCDGQETGINLTSAQARQVARALIAAADELDGLDEL